jgi:radical SAM protein with 4Fe4S-binding SPASM domain
MKQLTSSIHLAKLGFDVVHGCQLRCVGCPNSTIKPTVWPIQSEDFKKILSNIDVASVDLFRLFNFGEPLFNDNLGDILEQIKAWAVPVRKVEISTNGQYHNYSSLFAALDTGRLDSLAVSCDGDGTPEEYERLRPPGKWQKLMDFLQTVSKYVQKNNIQTKLINRTICSKPEHQARWRSVLTPLGWIPEFRDWQLLPESLLSLDPSFTDQFTPGKGICSFISRDTLYLDASGEVVTCCVHPTVASLGNLKDSKFSQIYTGKRKEFAEYLDSKRSEHPICSQCHF